MAKINRRFLYIHVTLDYTCVRKEVLPTDQVKIGSFIAARRKAQGFTQAALAERLGITDRAISKWENGVSHS